MAKEDPRRYPKGEGVESRPITVSDADSAYEILKMSAVAASCDPPPREAIVRTLQQLEPTLAADSLILFVENAAVAVAVLFLPPASGDDEVASVIADVLPAYRGRGLEQTLCHWMDERTRQAKDAGGRLHQLRSSCDLRNIGRLDLLGAMGFEPVRYAYKMHVQLTEPPSLPTLPAELRLIPWDAQRSSQALRVFNRAFAGHWGLPEIDEGMWQQRFLGVEQSRMDLSWMVLEGDDVVGLCINWVLPPRSEDDGERGWIEAIGVVPEYRGRGIADAMMAQSLLAFYESGLSQAGLDVDTQNETGALTLYEKHGFHPAQQTVILVKSV